MVEIEAREEREDEADRLESSIFTSDRLDLLVGLHSNSRIKLGDSHSKFKQGPKLLNRRGAINLIIFCLTYYNFVTELMV